VEKVQFKIGGMSCSFCAETIRKALTRMEGVNAVHVSLAHEETLIEYDPAKVAPQSLKDTLTAHCFKSLSRERCTSLYRCARQPGDPGSP